MTYNDAKLMAFDVLLPAPGTRFDYNVVAGQSFVVVMEIHALLICCDWGNVALSDQLWPARRWKHGPAWPLSTWWYFLNTGLMKRQAP